MIKVSERSQRLKPSPILMLAAKAAQMRAEGIDVISLSIGEPDWHPYQPIKQAAIQVIEEGKTQYTPPAGIISLREAIAEQAEGFWPLGFQAKHVTVSSGAKFILVSALHSILNPGDEVVLIAPFWASYPELVTMVDGRVKIIKTGPMDRYKLTPENLLENLTDKSRVLLLNSPSNPTGQVYTADELAALAEIIRRFPKLVVLTDDIYNLLSFDGKRAPHLLDVAQDLRDRMVIVNGASKAYAMTGWRLGWAIAPEPLIKAMTSYQSQTVSCPSAVAQYAALAALKKCDNEVAKTAQMLRERCQLVIAELEKIPGFQVFPPQGAFYIWVDIRDYLKKSGIESSQAFAAKILEKTKVAVVPGSEFGAEGCFRISYALDPDRAIEAIQRIGKVVSS